MKVTLLFLVVSLVPLGVVSAFSIRTAEKLITHMVSSHLESVADDKLDLLERWLSERKADLKVVADSSIIRSMDPSSIASYLRLVRRNYKVYRDFVVISRDGDVVFNSRDRGVDHSNEQWFKEAMAGRFYQSEIIHEPGSRESVFRISSPVYNEEGEIKGAVCATVGTESIVSLVLQVSLGETGESYLVNDEGTFLAHKYPEKILTENIARSGSFEKIFRGSQYQFYMDYRGIEVLGASRHIEGTDWYLVVEQDREEAFAGVFRLKRYLYAAIVLSILGALILAWLLAYYIVNPIRRLNDAAHSLARGRFEDAVVDTRRGDEIGALFSAFADMSRQLKARQYSLEEKVDLTEAELKEADVKLRQTEEAAARSERLAALGRLAAGVTHEIRTPLTSIKLFLESVKGDIEISPEYEEDFGIAMKQVLRIESTINKFLDFARPQDPVLSTIDVAQLVDDILLMVQPRAVQQEIMVKKHIAAGLPAVSGDKRQLGEALLNLMVNAIEVMSKGDVLTVSASPVRSLLHGRMKECVSIDVSDTGEGIKPENLERLFDPFFTTKASGTGLGLSIVNSTVNMHGGEVTVNSVPGRGTTFSVFLPVTANVEE
ncbi:MAG: cache domain-containing protein [bacterium]